VQGAAGGAHEPTAAGAAEPTRRADDRSIGTTVQQDAHPPHAWRTLSSTEQARFDLGYAVFNTEWVPANTPPGRIDGLGPLFNSQSCDACHNSRRRGRGPRGDGEAPSDLVVQLGRVSSGPAAKRRVRRGSRDYGFVLNTSAIRGFDPEARVWIQYEPVQTTLADGTIVELRQPHYRADKLSGPELPADTVLMPRMPPPVQGAGLLERVPQFELEQVAHAEGTATADIRGRISWLQTRRGRLIGRFGWQASEPTVASQTAVAFAREMGLTNPLVSRDDCGSWNVACRTAPTGGSPEVQADLFEAVLAFERWHAVPVMKIVDESSLGARLFESSGCSECHRPSLRIDLAAAVIHPYTDLLLHAMGQGLADRDLSGTPAPALWRTAPLWGMHAASASGQPLHLLHDGRARSIEEAILWHDAEARRARDNYARLSQQQRRALTEWIQDL
jgi:CxxC motif-containing protein (DUF1111 family)